MTMEPKLHFLRSFAEFCHDRLMQDADHGKCRQAMASMGVLNIEDVCSTYRIGYAPESKEDVREWARNIDYPHGQEWEQTLERLLPEFGRYCGRMVIPLEDEKCEVVGLVGRILSEEVVPKYIASPDSDVFSKDEYVYGLVQTIDALQNATSRSVHVYEGQVDVWLALKDTNGASVCGIRTAKQAEAVAKVVDEAVLVFDKTPACEKLADIARGLLAAAGVRIA